jgi:hypothetical protein
MYSKIFVYVSEIFLRINIRFDYYLFISDRLAIIYQYPTLSECIRSDITQFFI